MDKAPIPQHRRSRRKGERRVRVYGTDQLIALFECEDIYELVAKLRAQRLQPYVLGGEPVACVVERLRIACRPTSAS